MSQYNGHTGINEDTELESAYEFQSTVKINDVPIMNINEIKV